MVKKGQQLNVTSSKVPAYVSSLYAHKYSGYRNLWLQNYGCDVMLKLFLLSIKKNTNPVIEIWQKI